MGNKIIIGVIIVALILIIGVLAMNRGAGISPSNQISSSVSEQSTAGPTQSVSSVANEVVVTVTATGFTPQTTTIKKGTQVVWMNKSGKVADVSSAAHPTHLVYPPLNLGNFAAEESVSLTFEEVGTYRYHNHLEPAKTGVITVE